MMEFQRSMKDGIVNLHRIVDGLLEYVEKGSTDSNYIAKVDECTREVEKLRSDVARRAMVFTARFQPLARDLILAESIISASYSLERVARYAREIAILVDYVGNIEIVSEDAIGCLRIARKMLKGAIEALVSGRTEPVDEIMEMDEEVDKIYHAYLSSLCRGQLGVREASSLLFARHVERIADHASSVAETAKNLWG